jgi:Phage integrase family
MTFAELFTTLHARGLIPKRAPAKQSSLRHLAKALGYPTLESAPVGEACRDPARWTDAMKTYFVTLREQGRTMTAHNCDNILTDLRGLLKLADAQGLLTAPLPVRLLTTSKRKEFERQKRGASPYQDTYRRKVPYRLPQAQWPADIQGGWQDYTDRLDRRLRENTLEKYVFLLETFFGFVAHVQGDIPTWDDLFRVDLLRQFVRWHGERLGRDDNSAHGVKTVRTAAAIANVLELDQSLPLDQSRRPLLVAYARKLKPPAPLRDKQRYHWATLVEIEAVANSLLAEGRVPFVTRHGIGYPGAKRASQFQLGLILKLLVRVPLRQRNIRELHYPKHLWQDASTGEWTLRFTGKELKVATRKGRVNVFEVRLSRLYPKDGPTPDDLIPTLETFITDYRPLLPNAKTSPSLFLTHRGHPFSATVLGQEIVTAMERRTGVKLNPHMIRDIAATTLLGKGHSYDRVAALLGNTVATVIKHYAHLIPEREIAQAAGELGKILRTG